MERLLRKLLILALCVLLVCFGVDYVYRRIYQLSYPLPTHVTPNPPIAQKYQIVKVGNSHSRDGITFKGYKLRSLDLSGSAQRFRYDRVMLEQFANQIDDNAIIIIDVSQLSFSHRKADASDGLQYNYYGAASPILIPDLKWDDYLQSQIVPFLRAGYLWRQSYADAVQARIAEEEKSPELKAKELRDRMPTPAPGFTSSASAAINIVSKPAAQPATTEKKLAEPSPVKVVTTVVDTNVIPTPSPSPLAKERVKELLLHPSEDEKYFNVDAIHEELAQPSAADAGVYIDNMNFIYHKWLATDEFDKKYFATNRQDLDALIAYCLQHHWRPVLVTVPVTQILEKGLPSDYMQTYLYDNLKKTNLHGAPYIDFSTHADITEDNFLFSNADHLNRKGAAIFSYFLLQELIHRNYVSPQIDGYDYRPMYGFVEK